MASTSSFHGDPGRLPSDTRLRILPADQDPHLTAHPAHRALGLLDQPPPWDCINFPPLSTSSKNVAQACSPRIIPTYSYSDVLKLDQGRPPCVLDRLPLEIREKIWQACISIKDGVQNHAVLRKFCPNLAVGRSSFLPDVCLISKSTRDETVSTFLRCSIFHIPSYKDNVFLSGFLASVENGHRHVRELNFWKFDLFPDYDRVTGARIPVNADLELAVRCSGLHTLHLSFSRSHLGTFTIINGIRTFAPHSVNTLVAKYRLRRILDCKDLRKIEYRGLCGGVHPPPVLQELADWVQAESASINRVIECEVNWGWL